MEVTTRCGKLPSLTAELWRESWTVSEGRSAATGRRFSLGASLPPRLRLSLEINAPLLGFSGARSCPGPGPGEPPYASRDGGLRGRSAPRGGGGGAVTHRL
ncbi:unnamed protein product [Rangifer tarandus platyrhynchus]|uniref:Uncharacterized protein n=2 Tax=Rangifer tarandus platyrhynchus TaxID=3082113 RepID=A0ACB0E1G7_RANTA|nr:unnamed protein product [Rangifer tarandus platyrhynchus]CAI9694318.1 unnamed protein product [Rangifer tarandus platyrhynchus]